MNETVSKPSVTTTLLRGYFSHVKDLRTYISEILEPVSKATHLFERKNDSANYTFLLHATYVAFNDPVARVGDLLRPPFEIIAPVTDMREILDRVQERIFRLAGYRKPQNIVTAGYRRVSRDGDTGKQGSRVGISNYFVNTIVTALQSPEWETLLQRIGVNPMLYLLSETNIFISLPNGCLCQMTGEPIVTLVPNNDFSALSSTFPERSAGKKRPCPWVSERPVKRLKSIGSVSASRNSKTAVVYKRRTPVEINLVRTRLFYGRPQRLPKSNSVIVGLPAKHILNRIYPSYERLPKIDPEQYVDPDPKEQLKHARHLSKYVFPRQYGLNNPFVVAHSRNSAFYAPDYMDRETEIKSLGPCKTPKRLKEILTLLESMIWRHKKCGYVPLRDKVCPSKLQSTTESKQLDLSVILECVSEQSILLSQMPPSIGNSSIDSNGNPIQPFGSTQAERHARAKPRFADFACPFFEVYRYVVLVTKSVIPKAFWGNGSNFKLVMKYVEEFIQCRRFETLTLHHILHGFSTSACDWLMPPGEPARRQSRVSVSDALKRRELLEEFIFWYFDSFVSCLLKNNFYITETSAFRNHVLYFRHDDWATMCAPLIERLSSNTFLKMSDAEANEVLRQRNLGFSFVRLLPKETGVRPIVNLARRKSIQRGYQLSELSINQILQAAFQILTYEKYNQPARLGASVFSPDDIYMKIKDYKARLPRNPDGTLPQLYFVKVDVQACFDTIEQSKLLDILRDLISEDMYMRQKYGQVQMMTGYIKRTYVAKAIPEGEHPHFLTTAAKLAGVLRNTIFSDQIVYPYAQKREILALLEEHITENIVKIGSNYYRQTIGIPQGSILSALLCCFFYGDMEKRFTNFSDDAKSVLLRLIDDYLFITTSRTKAIQFLAMMSQGHPEYGCFISKDKTLTNFDYEAQILNVVEAKQQRFPWCGYLIDMKNLSVTVDYQRYNGSTLRNTLTVDHGRRLGVTFANRMIKWVGSSSILDLCINLKPE
ncbi:hypothetical protein C0989_004091 [Termitomyces sp. Mn162]|nr:hypothetical protein C0989_004091 [Termitomyces sp. Mn162]